MNTQEMNKEQYVAYRVEKNNVEKEVIEDLWIQFQDDAKAYGIFEQDTLSYIKSRFVQTFKKQELKELNTIEIEFIVIGIQEKDWGIKNHYKDALHYIKNADGSMKSQDVLDQAIASGLVNSELQPLFSSDDKYVNKKGKVIDLDAETTVEIKTLVKDGDSWKDSKILSSKKDLKNYPKTYSYNKANVGKGKADGVFYLNSDNITLIQEVGEDKIKELIKTFYGDIICKIENFEKFSLDYPDPKASKYDKFVFFKGDIVDITLNGDDKNNRAVLVSKTDEDATTTVWIPPYVNIDFDSKSQDVMMFGTLSVSEANGEILSYINCYSIFTPDKFKKRVNPTPITPEPKKELTPAEVAVGPEMVQAHKEVVEKVAEVITKEEPKMAYGGVNFNNEDF